jgi:hypothetical protein
MNSFNLTKIFLVEGKLLTRPINLNEFQSVIFIHLYREAVASLGRVNFTTCDSGRNISFARGAPCPCGS